MKLAIASVLLAAGSFAFELPGGPNYIPGFNLFDFLQGSGPWTQYAHGFSSDVSVPDGCLVEKVFLASRHGERFPASGEFYLLEASVSKMKNMPFLRDKMQFLRNYEFYTTVDTAGSETDTGTYNGVQFAIDLGNTFAQRYGWLLLNPNDAKLNIYTASSGRVVETAQNFAKGFFHGDSSKYNIVDLSEDASNGYNSLTPDFSCGNIGGGIAAVVQDAIYTAAATPIILARLTNDYGAYGIGVVDLFTIGQMCAFELNALGDSKFCDILNENEWIELGYQADIALYNTYGPGSWTSRAAGSVYLNNTLTLMEQEGGPNLFFNFMHDNQLQTIFSAMNIPEQPSYMADNYNDQCGIQINNGYFASQLTPMGAHFTLELLSYRGEKYVRAIISESVVAIPGCTSGPGGSCPYWEFAAYERQRFVDLKSRCSVPESEPQYTTFYWDNISTA